MSDTLTQLISRVQSLLGDTGAIFPTTTCTAAIRQALTEFNRRVPQLINLTIPGESDQLIYDITIEDPNAIKVSDVLQQAEGTDIPLTFDEYLESEHVFIRLRQSLSSTETLIVRYTTPHTISGLDGASESSLPASYDQIIVTGAAYWAIHIRATSRVEMINMSNELAGDYAQAMQAFRSFFEQGLSEAARRHTPPIDNDSRAWNDRYHTWDQ
jgi:hypothetical protein